MATGRREKKKTEIARAHGTVQGVRNRVHNPQTRMRVGELRLEPHCIRQLMMGDLCLAAGPHAMGQSLRHITSFRRFHLPFLCHVAATVDRVTLSAMYVLYIVYAFRNPPAPASPSHGAHGKSPTPPHDLHCPTQKFRIVYMSMRFSATYTASALCLPPSPAQLLAGTISARCCCPPPGCALAAVLALSGDPLGDPPGDPAEGPRPCAGPGRDGEPASVGYGLARRRGGRHLACNVWQRRGSLRKGSRGP